MPSGFPDFVEEAHKALSYAAVRAVKLWRWRIGYRSDQNPIRRFKSFEWSIDGEDWKPAPVGIELGLRAGIPRSKITDELVESILSLSQSDIEEPLAHELFQEAWGQRDANPRSALVMGIAAAETGVKHLISTLVPAAERPKWLVKHTQSPPLVRLLEEYLPLLPTRLKIKGKVLPPPTWLIEEIRDGVTRRNKIVHGDKTELKSDSLLEILKAVHDLLYLFDLYAGHEWAAQHLSVRMCSSLANEV